MQAAPTRLRAGTLSPAATAAALILLAGVAVLAHRGLYLAGFAFQDSDDATVPIVTNLFRQGEWSPFYLQQNYGGTALTVVRTFWVALWERLFSGEMSHVNSQMSFTYGVVPILLTWATFFLVRAYSSFRAAWVVGLAAAVGLQFWTVELLQRDFYTAYLLMGFVLLTLRARYRNPFSELSEPGLVGIGLLSGFALYTCRASAVFVLPFFLSEERVFALLRRFLKPQGKLEKTLTSLIWVLIVLFIYITLFGQDMGLIFGRKIKMEAFPNLKIAMVFGGLWWAKVFFEDAPKGLRRVGLLLAGGLVGFLPEIIYTLNHRSVAPALFSNSAQWKDVAEALGSVPQRILEVVAAGNGFLRHFSIALFVAAAVSFQRQISKDDRLKVLRFVAVLCVIGFFLVHQSATGVTRHLIPLSPFLMVILGVLVDRVFSLGKVPAQVTLVFLLALHGAHQISGRAQYIASRLSEGKWERAEKILSVFRGENVNLVIADDYWLTNQYTYLGKGKPLFISNGRVLGVAEAFRLQDSEKHVGIILSQVAQRDPDPAEIELNKRSWRLRKISELGSLRLYVGDR